jgi:hypothetical protein
MIFESYDSDGDGDNDSVNSAVYNSKEKETTSPVRASYWQIPRQHATSRSSSSPVKMHDL